MSGSALNTDLSSLLLMRESRPKYTSLFTRTRGTAYSAHDAIFVIRIIRELNAHCRIFVTERTLYA